MKKVFSIIFIALLLVPFSSQQLALAFPPVANQIVPIAIINTAASAGVDAFGVTYDPVNDLIWVNSVAGTSLEQYTPLKNLNIAALPIDGGTGLPQLAVTSGAPTPLLGGLTSLEALGFDPISGQILIHQNGSPDTIEGIDPFTGANKATYSTPAIDAALVAAGTGFVDGLDVNGADVYWSPEPGITKDSFKNSALFLDNMNVLQTDISAVWVGNGAPIITRWAGIEVVNNFVYAVSEVDSGADRTIATYDLLGNFVAVDPDGDPIAQRFEDLAFDGVYLYGADAGGSRIFVFDVVGPGGLPQVEGLIGGEIIPIESTSLILVGTQSFSWMIPVVLSIAGIGLFVFRKSENS